MLLWKGVNRNLFCCVQGVKWLRTFDSGLSRVSNSNFLIHEFSRASSSMEYTFGAIALYERKLVFWCALPQFTANNSTNVVRQTAVLSSRSRCSRRGLWNSVKNRMGPRESNTGVFRYLEVNISRYNSSVKWKRSLNSQPAKRPRLVHFLLKCLSGAWCSFQSCEGANDRSPKIMIRTKCFSTFNRKKVDDYRRWATSVELRLRWIRPERVTDAE